MHKILITLAMTVTLIRPLYAEDLTSINLPLFDVMHGMKTEWVAKKMIYNGQPMSIQNFSINRSPKDVVRHFESRWKVQGMGQLKHQKIGDELTIGFVDRGYTYSVQVRENKSGSVGSLVVTRNKEFKQTKIQFPIYPDSQVVSRIHSVDMGVKSETITLSSYRSASMQKQWYRSILQRNGWIGQEGSAENRGQTLEYQKGKELCQLIFMGKNTIKDNRSIVMIHWIKG